MSELKRYWLVKVIPEFIGVDEATGEELVFKNWRQNVIEMFAENERQVVFTAEITGILKDVHYNDIVEVKGCV